MTTIPACDPARTLRMAVIGCGPIGRLHAQAIVAAPQARLAAVCELDAKRRESAGDTFNVPAYEDPRRLFAEEQLDAVAIATPDHLHVEPTLAAIEAGCHVFCEKPLATQVCEAQRLVSAARNGKVHLGVDYNRRFAFGYRTARRLLDEGAIGRLQTLRIQVSDRTPPPHVARHPFVIFTTLLTHHLDLLGWFGGEIVRLQAVAGHQPIGPLLREVAITCEFEGGSGMIAARYRDDLTQTVESLELEGTGGAIRVEGACGGVVLKECSSGVEQRFEPADDESFYDSVVAHVRAFIEQVASGAAPPVSGADGLSSLKLAAAAVKSIELQQAIEVPNE